MVMRSSCISILVPLFLCCRRFRLFYSRIKSLHLHFGRPVDLLPAGRLSLEILINPSESILDTCLSHFLLFISTNNTEFSDWMASYSI